MNDVREDEKRSLIENKVLLDGKPAVLRGVKLDFCAVCVEGKSGLGPCYDWSWEAVKRIVSENEGKFFS